MKNNALRFACALTAAIALFGERSGAQETDLLKELDVAFQKGVSLHKEGKSELAIPFLEKAASLAPKVFGPDHLNTAAILNATGFACLVAGKNLQAEQHYRQCLEIRQAKLPKMDLNTALTLSNLGMALDRQGKSQEAQAILKRCLEIREAKLPKNSDDLALTLNNLAAVCHTLADYEEAERYLKRSLGITEDVYGKGDGRTASTLHNLSETYRQMGRLQEAEAAARRSLAIRQAKGGKDHLDVSQNLSVLGILCDTQGRFKEADLLFREALDIREKKLGKDSVAVATILNNLAVLYSHMDRLDESEKFHRRALAILETQLGPDHPSVATALSNFAGLLSDLGQNAEAEKLLLRGLAIEEAKLGKDHPNISSTLANLASLYQLQGRWKEAESSTRRALSIVESRLGKNHSETVIATSNLAMLYVHMNRLPEALPLLNQTLQLREARFGKDHPDVGLNLFNLGGIYLRTGAYDKATELYQRSLEITEKSFGKHSEGGARILLNQAAVRQNQGLSAEALKAHDRCLEIYQAKVRNLFAYSRESAIYDYLENNSGKLPIMMSLAAQNKNDASTAQAFDWMLRLKGVVFDTLCRFRQAQHLLDQDAPLQASVSRYRSRKEFLANLALTPPSAKDAERIKKQMAQAQQEVADLEQELSRAVSRKMPELVAGSENITARAVQARLPADGVLIEFVRTPIRDFKASTWLPNHYFAFVLTPGTEAPKLIDLGSTKEIDDGVEALRKEFLDFQEKLAECETVEEAKMLEKSQEKRFKEKSAALHAIVMAPLAKAIGAAKLLYVAADGALNRLPFECLVADDGKYLVERQRCAYLSSGRDMLRASGTPAKGTVVFAGPDYKLDASERIAQAEKLLNKKGPNLARLDSPGRNLRSAGFKALPGAAAEAKDIQKLLTKSDYGPVKTYVGAEALEEVLKAMPAPRILHLATHGFFLDRDTGPPESSEDIDDVGAGSARKRLKRMENPLLRSGIVLAGANTIGDKDAPAKVEDGWVTAEEIALLNLHGTELVVLSACQTGLGDLKTGEGVYGLRRAFLHAGARTLVTSLFEVPDTETRELMQRFYTGINAGSGKLRALHGAQIGMIEARRQTRGAAHPFFWASFVLVGNSD